MRSFLPLLASATLSLSRQADCDEVLPLDKGKLTKCKIGRYDSDGSGRRGEGVVSRPVAGMPKRPSAQGGFGAPPRQSPAPLELPTSWICHGHQAYLVEFGTPWAAPGFDRCMSAKKRRHPR